MESRRHVVSVGELTARLPASDHDQPPAGDITEQSDVTHVARAVDRGRTKDHRGEPANSLVAPHALSGRNGEFSCAGRGPGSPCTETVLQYTRWRTPLSTAARRTFSVPCTLTAYGVRIQG
jgi:hypothetical protein